MINSSLLFLQHPDGDQITLPCTHLEQVHSQGDPVQVLCTHGLRHAHARPGPRREG